MVVQCFFDASTKIVLTAVRERKKGSGSYRSPFSFAARDPEAFPRQRDERIEERRNFAAMHVSESGPSLHFVAMRNLIAIEGSTSEGEAYVTAYAAGAGPHAALLPEMPLTLA